MSLFKACRGECQALIKYQEPSICLCLSSEMTARQPRSRPHRRRGEGGLEAACLQEARHKSAAIQSISLHPVRIKLCAPTTHTPKAMFLCVVFFPFISSCGHIHLRSEDPLWSEKRQMKGTAFPWPASASHGARDGRLSSKPYPGT